MGMSSSFIIIRQPLCPVVGRRHQHAVSKLPCIVLSAAISCRSSICLGRLSTAWLVSPVVFSCRSPSGDTRGPSVVFEAVYMPCPGPFHFSHSVDYIYDFCPLPDPDVGLSIFVCDVEHTSFHFGLCGRKFVLCLFGQCPGLCTICHSWQHTGVVHMSLQADGKVAFADVPVFGVCAQPAMVLRCSPYLFVLVIFLEAVVLSQVHVALDIFYQHIVCVYWGVVYNHHL